MFTMKSLFGRELAMADIGVEVRSFYADKTVAIFGGAGSVGSALVSNLLTFTQAKVVILDIDESRLHSQYVNLSFEFQQRCKTHVTDIRDLVSVNMALDHADPELVIHAAALKHVSVLEQQPREAYLTNLVGTANILKALQHRRVDDFLFISTDKATDPQSILGKTKLLGERMVAFAQSRTGSSEKYFSAVRFGNVFLSRGSVLETFIAAARRGEPLRVHDFEMTRYFMELDDAARIILTVQALRLNKIGILKMGHPIAILELAKKVIEVLGSSSEIEQIGVQSGEKIHESLVSRGYQGEVLDYDHFSLFDFELGTNPERYLSDIPSSNLEARTQIESSFLN